MENYEKGTTCEQTQVSFPLPLDDAVIHMRVNYGSKIRNLLGFALKKIKENEVSGLCWEGSGNAISKTVTCVEVMKKRMQGLHQLNHIQYKRIEELWEPKLEGLDRLKVNRDIPVLMILLSKVPLNSTHSGYQTKGNEASFLLTTANKRKADRGSKSGHPKGKGSSKPTKQMKGKRKPNSDGSTSTGKSRNFGAAKQQTD